MDSAASPRLPSWPPAVLDVWRFTAQAATAVDVFPDGCRDLIVSITPHAAPTCFVTALADRTERPVFEAAQRLVGVRLQAGARFDERQLLDQLGGRERFDDGDLLAAVGTVVEVDASVQDALLHLAATSRLDTARASLGVSERSLERLLSARTGRAPLYWRRLARARRCARALLGGAAEVTLGELALCHGYADQSHMTRDLRAWFGASPGRLRATPARFAALAASDHG